MASARDIVRVLDSCAWIHLIENDTDTLGKVIELAQLGALTIGVPDVVRQEVRPSAELVGGQTKHWKSRIGELRRCARILTEVQRHGVFDGSVAQVRDFETLLEEMLAAINAYKGDPFRDEVVRFLASKTPIAIPTPKVIHAQVVDHAIRRRKPFGEKNSVADALILFSVCHWATKHPDVDVHFYTLNKDDFADGGDNRKPHADLQHLFSPATNVVYHGGLGDLHKHVAGLRPYDFYPEPDPDVCPMCGEPVPIENLSCAACGTSHDEVIDEDGYTLTSYRDGYLVDIAGAGRLSCGHCGRKTFHVELASMCSYHAYTQSKDD